MQIRPFSELAAAEMILEMILKTALKRAVFVSISCLLQDSRPAEDGAGGAARKLGVAPAQAGALDLVEP